MSLTLNCVLIWNYHVLQVKQRLSDKVDLVSFMPFQDQNKP